MYTDDTQMSIAIAELLVSGKEFNRENLADKFVECYKRDPIKGYAKNFQKFLDSVSSGKEFIEKINPDSIRNGAAMRAVPIGVIKDLDTVVEYAKINASLTHNTSKGIASSVAVALMSHFSLYSGYVYDDKTFVKLMVIPRIAKIDYVTADYINLILEKHAAKGVPCDGMRTAGAMAYLLTNFYGPKRMLEESIKLGGDVDSVASISLGIRLINDDIWHLPSFLYDDLTNHKYGRDYILSLGTHLEEKFLLSKP
jgi:ADP-ribosyl-[dinitrogen reductase] hydrolase